MIPSGDILLTVAISSILGSLHCVGMCGSFVALCCIGKDQDDKSSRLIAAEISYHAMRLVSYVLLGAIAGTIGSFAGDLGEGAGFQRAFGIFAGGILVIWGLRELGFLSASLLNQTKLSSIKVKFVSQKLFRLPLQLKGVARGAFIGLLSGMLPCGWLYAYVITAAATQSTLGGAIVMAVFWIGTVPVLVVFATVLKRLDAYWLSKIPKITAVFIIALGVLAISGRVNMTHSMDHSGHSKTKMSCH